MADDNQQVCEEPRGQQQHGGPLSFVAAVMTVINRGVASVFHAATRDGTLAAAFRQGASEIGEALKAFPDSIHVHEPGTVLNPTQGEIAAARDLHAPSHAPSPSDIARGQADTVHGQQQGSVHGQPSPSDIARDNAGTVHGQEQAQSPAAPSPSDIARGNEQGQVLMQEKTWQEREIEREKARQEGNGENDQNERSKGRSLPDEQKEKEKEQERGRGR